MMGEPELEEEMLLTEQLENGEIRIERRTLGNAPSVAEVDPPLVNVAKSLLSQTQKERLSSLLPKR